MKQVAVAEFARAAWSRITAYAAHDDPMVEACNLIALVIVSNQPFYPLYVYWAVGGHISPTFFTFLSTPFFLAVPAVARWSPTVGRALLPLAGIANTVLSAAVFGQASGVAIFLIPCALIAAVFFRPAERLVGFVLIGLAFLAYFGIGGVLHTPVHLYSSIEYRDFFRLNAMSASMLTVFIGLVASGLMSRQQ